MNVLATASLACRFIILSKKQKKGDFINISK